MKKIAYVLSPNAIDFCENVECYRRQSFILQKVTCSYVMHEILMWILELDTHII